MDVSDFEPMVGGKSGITFGETVQSWYCRGSRAISGSLELTTEDIRKLSLTMAFCRKVSSAVHHETSAATESDIVDVPTRVVARAVLRSEYRLVGFRA